MEEKSEKTESNESKESMSPSHGPAKSNAALIIGICIGLLLVFSIVQAVEITSLKNEIKSLSGTATLSPQAIKAATSTPLPKTAPRMVGGC